MGVVTIEVIEARYGAVKLDNRSPVSTPLLKATLAPLQGTQTIGEAELDRSLLLLSEHSGRYRQRDLDAGTCAQNLRPRRRHHRRAWHYRRRVARQFRHSLHRPRASFGIRRLRRSAPSRRRLELQRPDVRSRRKLREAFPYELLLNGQGTRFGRIILRAALQAGRLALVARRPWLARKSRVGGRGNPSFGARDVNLYGQIEYDHLTCATTIDTGAIRTDRHLDTWTAKLSGDVRDVWIPGGIDIWSADWTGGARRLRTMRPARASRRRDGRQRRRLLEMDGGPCALAGNRSRECPLPLLLGASGQTEISTPRRR